MTRALETVPAGTTVFIDSSILIYHFAEASQECRRLLERCEKRDLKGVTSTAVLAEVTHRLMALEAVARGLVRPGNVARKLSEKPDVVRSLSQYHRAVEAVPVMGIRVESLDLVTMLDAHALRLRHGLLTNDSLVAAAALKHAEGRLASADGAFARVAGITLHGPRDLG